MLGAREVLVAQGIDRVKIDPLARALGVTTGSFYWHFEDRQALLSELLTHWEETNSQAMFDAVERESTPERQLRRLVEVWVDENGYSPAFDSAVRDWARVDDQVAAAVRRVDEARIDLIHGIFRRLGDPEPTALVRARIAYFHQVGYYAMHISESQADRHKLLPTYVALLLGRAED